MPDDQRLRVLLLATALLAGVGAPANAQQHGATDSLRLSPAWDVSRYQPYDAALSFKLTRPLAPNEGRIAVIVGQADLSALLEQRGTAVYRDVTLDGGFDESLKRSGWNATWQGVVTGASYLRLGRELRHRLAAGHERDREQCARRASARHHISKLMSPGGTRRSSFFLSTWHDGVDFYLFGALLTGITQWSDVRFFRHLALPQRAE